jgi:HAMP domain-containing protein
MNCLFLLMLVLTWGDGLMAWLRLNSPVNELSRLIGY